MATTARFAEISTLAGDPARAAMLQTLMDGRALTATELSRVAGVAPQTASSHLARLLASGLLTVEKQGRHHYHRLASPAVARMMESIMQVAADSAPGRRTIVTGPRDGALRAARTCYDHIAGRLGVALTDALVREGHVELSPDGGVVTDTGLALLDRIGLDAGRLMTHGARSKRVLCRPCLDWSERRPHLAGVLGAALCRQSFDEGWIRRVEGTRAVAVTPKGQRIFRETLKAELG
jgi:DNA-binding transcriptional ArsR family regulator/ribosomal protein S19E (S16A)